MGIAYCRDNTSWEIMLEVLHQEKDLGVVISNDLKVSQQCQQAYNKASRILGLINRTIEYRHRDILLRLYKSLVRPHLEYSISAWSPHYSKDKVLIERIQRRFTKMIPSVRDLPYEVMQTEKTGFMVIRPASETVRVSEKSSECE